MKFATEEKLKAIYCVKSARVRNFSGPYFPALGSNMKHTESGKRSTRNTPNKDTIHVVSCSFQKLTLHKTKFSVMDFSRKCEQMHSLL